MLYDFAGYATRNDLTCSDGLTIRRGAFAHCDGKKVPLVYNHDHTSVANVIGYALLENRDDGVYCYGSFNDTPNGQYAKNQVEHGDIDSLSIFANRLKRSGKDVMHGEIREVSLVLAGANPGAHIEELSIEHSYDDEFINGEAIIYSDDHLEHKLTITIDDKDGDGIPDDRDPKVTPPKNAKVPEDDSNKAKTTPPEFGGADKQPAKPEEPMKPEESEETEEPKEPEEPKESEEPKNPEENTESNEAAVSENTNLGMMDKKTLQDIINTMSDEQKSAVNQIIMLLKRKYEGDMPEPNQNGIPNNNTMESAGAIQHSDDAGQSIGEIYNAMTEAQKACVHAFVGMALQSKKSGKEVKHMEDIYDESLVHDAFNHTESGLVNKTCSINYNKFYL